MVAAITNRAITGPLAEGAVEVARGAGVACDRYAVAGSFELPSAVAMLCETGRYDAVVPVGCLIRGETPHFDVLARAIADGLMELSISYPIAIPFGVLTCDTAAQARARAGGREGNKGAEAMAAALWQVALRQSLTAGASRRSRRAASASSRRTS